MPSWFTGLFAGGFLNPGIAALGTLLVSVPIIIHLINRLRYKRVEFAAMQFLLESEQQNRRRILVEQLLLLLLRILAVLLVTLLIGRVVFDSSQLSVIRGGVSNQIILLDDSMSTAERGATNSAFDRAKETVSRLIRAAAEASTQQRVTVIRLSEPTENPATLTEQVVDARTADEMILAIERFEPSAETGEWLEGLEAVGSRLGEDTSEKTTLLIVTDSRATDWGEGTSANVQGVSTQLQQFDSQGVIVNIVQTVKEASDNLAITNFETIGATTAVRVPMRLRVTVTNFGEQPATNVRVAVEVDGSSIPQAIVFESIDPNASQTDAINVVFEEAGPHRVRVTLPPDVLDTDNERFLALDVPEQVGVLLVDGDPAGTDAQYIADALAADRDLTGFEPLIIGPAELARTALDRFQGIYLVNVGDLSAEVITALQNYVRDGGGLVSFVGSSSRPEFINDRLVPAGLFPVPIAAAPEELSRVDGLPDIVATDHPAFAILSGTDNPFLDQVFVHQYLPASGGVDEDSETVSDAESIKVIASLRNGDPLVFDHRLGNGRVVTLLTSAGPGETTSDGATTWNNWARSPSYPVLILELQNYVTAGNNATQTAFVGQSIPFALDPVLYRERIAVTSPNGDVSGIQALASSDSESRTLNASFDDTQTPGVYRIVLEDANGEAEIRTQAFNINPTESNLATVDEDGLRKSLAGVSSLTVRDGTDLGWIEAAASGSSLRMLLIVALLVLLTIEQWWASRLSYPAK